MSLSCAFYRMEPLWLRQKLSQGLMENRSTTALPRQRREASCQEPRSSEQVGESLPQSQAHTLVPPSHLLPCGRPRSRFSEHGCLPALNLALDAVLRGPSGGHGNELCIHTQTASVPTAEPRDTVWPVQKRHKQVGFEENALLLACLEPNPTP